MKFGLIGDGKVAQYHRAAIKHIGGDIAYSVDPKYGVRGDDGGYVDYIVICSPSHLHREQTKQALERGMHRGHRGYNVIVEKPAVLPWEPLIDDDRVNVVLQMQYLENLPQKAELVEARFIRDKEYFESWKGDPMLTGGLFFNLFIHSIHLAKKLGADFRGEVATEGIQYKNIIHNRGKIIDILNVDKQGLYNRMYEAIIAGKGTKPKELFYLHYLMRRYSERFGFGKNGLNKIIRIDRDLL